MAQVPKYAQLPDLDNAPDIYETPELTDDASTLQTSTTARSHSPSESEASDIANRSGVNRSRLHPDRARSHFLPSRVDAREADFSDRLTTKKQAYRVSNRKRRDGAVIENEDEGVDEWSDEDVEESLERKIARLKREVEEVRAEYARQKEEGNNEGEVEHDTDTRPDDSIEALSRALDTVRESQRDAMSAHAQLTKQLSMPSQAPRKPQQPNPQGTTEVFAQDPVDAETWNSIADFDTRLSSLEKALGLGSLDIASSNQTSTIIPILPTISLLDNQLSLLTSTDAHPHLEALVQKLQAPQPETKQTANGDGESEDTQLTSEDVAKLRSLYSLLPTLTDLSPTLPPLLARLRSLRQLHAGAAGASQDLYELERRQRDTEQEIADWKTGLEKVEEAIQKAEEGMKGNVDVIEVWVKDLEGKLKGLDLDR